MKNETDVWYIFSNQNNEIEFASNGKWIISGKQPKRILEEINNLVENGIFHSAKYAHKKKSERDPLPLSPPVLLVYANDDTKKETYTRLIEMGLKPKAWKYDSETTEDWKEDGKLSKMSSFQIDYLKTERLKF